MEKSRKSRMSETRPGIGVVTDGKVATAQGPSVALTSGIDGDCDCEPDSDADTDSRSSTAVFLHLGAHRAHESLSLRRNGGGSCLPAHQSVSQAVQERVDYRDGDECQECRSD